MVINMKCLMSINEKFMKYTPKDLVDLVKENSKYVDGFEIYINASDKNQVDYLKQISFECNKENIYLQIHGDSSLSMEQQQQFLILLNEISDFLGYKINVVLHPITSTSIADSIKVTTIYMAQVIEMADLNKVVISLENLNDYLEEDRLNKEDIIPIIANNEHLYFTYDIGHEISEYGNLTGIDDLLLSRLSNVHIHTINYHYSEGFDHKPIYEHDQCWNKLIKGLTYLKNNHYDKGIVFEYDLYECPGEDLKEKIISYAKSIDYVAERIK